MDVENYHIKYQYTELYLEWSDIVADWRVRPLVLYIKKWARFHDINDASKATISSYSLCLMLIHYLQCKSSANLLSL